MHEETFEKPYDGSEMQLDAPVLGEATGPYRLIDLYGLPYWAESPQGRGMRLWAYDLPVR